LAFAERHFDTGAQRLPMLARLMAAVAAGGGQVTVRVKFCLTVPEVFLAVMLTG
jgi:hypothetical protein